MRPRGTPLIGQRLGHYRILEKLGSGGMGEVYAAEDTRLGRKVALKILPGAMAADPERRNRFESEARAVAALNHPNIVTLYSVEEADGIFFLTMELVHGKTLAEIVSNQGLPLQHFFVIVNLRILLEQLLILLERALVVAFCFIATTKQILSAWSVVGKRPRANRSASGFESKAVIPLIESFLRDLLLVLGPRPGPFAAPNGFVGPTLAGPINQRGRDSQRQRD